MAGTDLEMREERVAERLRMVQAKIRDKLAGMAADAVEVVAGLMEGAESEKVRDDAASKVLSPAGIGDVRQTEQKVTVDLSVDQEAAEVLAKLQKNVEVRQLGEVSHTPVRGTDQP